MNPSEQNEQPKVNPSDAPAEGDRRDTGEALADSADGDDGVSTGQTDPSKGGIEKKNSSAEHSNVESPATGMRSPEKLR